MQNRRKLFGWGVAVVAVAAMVTAGSVYASEDRVVVTGTASSSLTSAEQRSALVSLAEQPETRFVRGPMTLKDAAAIGAFQAAPGLEFKPASCGSYADEVLGSLGSRDGWVQFGSRVHADHNDNFIQAVINVPGGADAKLIERLREAAFKCKTGSLTLEGKVTGDITFTERKLPALSGATSFGVTGTTRFSGLKPGSTEAALVQRYEMPPNAQLLVGADEECVEATNFVAVGDTLIVTMESDADLSNFLSSAMYNKVARAMAN